MYDKDLKRLSRQELLELLLEQSKQLNDLQQRFDRQEEKLNEREAVFSESGNLAEAALKVNHYFEAAQKASEYYIEQAKLTLKKATQIQTEAEQKLAEAEALGKIPTPPASSVSVQQEQEIAPDVPERTALRMPPKRQSFFQMLWSKIRFQYKKFLLKRKNPGLRKRK